jgi:cell division protein FtsB
MIVDTLRLTDAIEANKNGLEELRRRREALERQAGGLMDEAALLAREINARWRMQESMEARFIIPHAEGLR